MTASLNGTAPIAHLGVIAVAGDDAASFLQNQLTNDFALLGMDRARLAAYCTAKGRMLASFVGFKRSEGEILLVMSRDILPQTLKRLSMYVLRAKAKLRDATAEFDLAGLAGSAAKAHVQDEPWKLQRDGDTVFVTLYRAGDTARVLRVAPAGAAGAQGESTLE